MKSAPRCAEGWVQWAAPLFPGGDKLPGSFCLLVCRVGLAPNTYMALLKITQDSVGQIYGNVLGTQ